MILCIHTYIMVHTYQVHMFDVVQGLDEEKPYTDEEFAKFERDYEEHDQVS